MMTAFSLHPFPVINTERLHLRELQLSDAEAIFTLRSDEVVNAFIARPRAGNIADAISFISKIQANIKENKAPFWAISLAGKNELIGTIALWNISENGREAEIGFEILPSWSGKGYMKEAAAAVMNYGFKNMGLLAISAWTHVDNRKSIRLLELLNFTNTGPAPGANHYIYCRTA